METAPISQPSVDAATPSPAPAPAPTPTPAPAPIVAAPNVVMGEGGATTSSSGDNSLKGFFASLNWMEITFSVLGVAALSYVIYYYRFKTKQDKMINSELQRQIDELKMNMQTKLQGKYKTL